MSVGSIGVLAFLSFCSFRSTEAIKAVGLEKMREAFQDAHTQHKDGTDKGATLLADTVEEWRWE